jgi:putative cardiolipin synthase
MAAVRHIKILVCLFLVLAMFMPGVVHSDKVKIIYKDQEALQIRADMIRQARSELNIAYFIVRNDVASVSGFALIQDAADRGVKVKVILDGLYQGISLPYIKVLTSHPNIEIREYNRLSIFHLLRSFKRSHEKILIADNLHAAGFHYITGGRNVSDKYFGFGENRNFDDLDVYVSGESAELAREIYFNRLWGSSLVREISLGLYAPLYFEKGICLQARREDDYCTRSLALRKAAYSAARNDIRNRRNLMEIGRVPGLDWNSETRWDQHTSDVGRVRFLYDEPDANKNQDGIAAELYEILVSNKSIRDLTILSPYVILTARGFDLISRLSDRGVKITLITNSLNSTDNILAQAGYANNKTWLLDKGLRIYHYIGPNTIHAKALIINGGESVLIGTYNFDPRSAKLNREIGVQFFGIDDGLFFETLEDMVNRYISRSNLIQENGNPKGFDSAHPNASTFKKFIMGMLQPLVALPIVKKNL